MTIENILSTKSLRELSLVRFLIKNGPTHSTIIQKKLNYNGATLYRDIDQLNEIITPAQIIKRNSIALSIPTNLNNRYIFSRIMSNSSEFSLIEEIFFHEHHSLQSLSDKLFLSQSTVKRMIKKINSILKEYDIVITSFPIKITGTEKHVCNLIIRIFEEKYSNHNFPFKKEIPYALEKIISQNLKKESLHLNYPDIEQAKLMISVIMKRMQNGNSKILTNFNLPEIYWDSLNKPFYKRIFKSIFKIDLTKQNISYLFYPFFRNKFALDFKQLNQLQNEFPEVKKILINFKKLINNIAIHYSIEIENEKDLIFHLYNTNELTLTFSHIIYNKSKEFLDTLTEYNEEFIIYMNKNLVQLGIEKNKQNGDIYALPYILVTHWKNLAIQLQKSKPKILVGLLFDSDIEHMLFIKDLLSNKFAYQLDIVLIENLQIKKLEKNIGKLDLIVTNVPELNINFHEIICTSMYPSPSDLYKIEQRYQSIVSTK